MCTSPYRVFYTGLRTENDKDLLVFCQNYPVPDRISLDYAERRLGRKIPFVPEIMEDVSGHVFLLKSVEVPCGKCDDCRLTASRNWAYRCLMESKYHSDNWFVTLTFSDEFLPSRVDTKDVTMFMKRLRFRLSSPGMKFFASGEYGSKTKRPHYHLILFGCRLDDLMILDASKGLYRSKLLESVWPYGQVAVGEVTQESCAYVARYSSKKVGDRKGFIQMSRRPGLGYRYLMDHKVAARCDYLPLMVNGALKRITPPRYFEKLNPGLNWINIKARRVENALARTRCECVAHSLDRESLDHYKRFHVYKSKMLRLEKKTI